MKYRKNGAYIWIILAVAAFALLLSGCKRDKRLTTELDAVSLGIDVARYQGTIDWELVAQENIGFAIVRVGYRTMADGIITEDSNGRYNLQEARNAGIPLGVYFFSTAITEEEAREEAGWVANLIRGYPITYPVVYDCENFNDPGSRQYGLSVKERTDIALAFLDEIEKLGYEGMFYASKVDMEHDKNWQMSRIEERYKVWVAQYPAVPYPETPESSYDGIHHMWQYAMDGDVAGISQPVDLNIAYFSYDGIEPAKSDEIPAEVKADPEALMDFREVNELVTAKEETNLRSIPSQDTDSVVLRTLKNGEIAQRIAISSSGWSKLVFEETVYYAVSSYLTTDTKYGYDTDIVISAEANEDDIQTKFHQSNEKVTAKDTVNLRSLPSVEREDCEIIAQLVNGEEALCVGTSDNGWSKLIYRGTTCYAITSYLMPLEEENVIPSFEEEDVNMDFSPVNETVTAIQKVNLRTVPNTEPGKSEILIQLQPGETAQRTGISSSGWSKLKYNGVTCYAVSMYLEKTDSVVGNSQVQTEFEDIYEKVTAKDEVNLRSLPSTEHPDCVIATKLKNGEIVIRTGINKELGWSRVEYNGQTLYCVTSYLKNVD